jgi:hypothetical protein
MSSRVLDLAAGERVPTTKCVGPYYVGPFPNPMPCVLQCNFSSFSDLLSK